MTYGNGVFLAVLINPTRLYRSSDGITWSKIAGPYLGTDTNITDYKQRASLAYGAGQFVLASDSGRIFSSPDLVTWIRSTTGTTHNIIAVKYLNNRFYAVGDTATFLSSPDGVNWNALHTGIGDTTGSYQDIFYGNGHLAIDAYNHLTEPSAIQVLYVNTGGVWTMDSSRQYYNHGFAANHFYEFARDSTSISDDMRSWSAVTYDAPTAGTANGVFDDSDHIFLLSNNYIYVNGSPVQRAFVSSSDDGIHFNNPHQASVYGDAAAYFNRRYFIWGGVFSGPMAGSADGFHYVILGRDSALLATSDTNIVKFTTTPDGDHFFTSTDFTNWSPGDTQQRLTSLTHDDTRFIATGPHTYASTDGYTWTDNGATPHAFSGIAYAGGHYIAWNQNATNSGPDSLWHSADAVNWTQATTPIHPSGGPKDPPYTIDYGHVARVRFLRDTIFVVGSEGLILHSSDGLTYSLDYGGNDLGPHLSDVAYDADSAKYFSLASAATALPKHP
ncbi:WD40/YVTN/BNR-like repeat-containing protein [Puia sp. P3]|uniref:WD40/YVTN/BNR-like repeat-containing protein n=1 Tax=Puia sp. P3 TaxID=3423952 RepID=UPI003D67BBB5